MLNVLLSPKSCGFHVRAELCERVSTNGDWAWQFWGKSPLTFLKSSLTEGLTAWPIAPQPSTLGLTCSFYSFASAPTPPLEPIWHSFWVRRALGAAAPGSCHSLSTPITLILFPLHSPLAAALRRLGTLTLGLRYHVAREGFLMKKKEQTLASLRPLSLLRETILERVDNPEVFSLYIFLS